MLIIKPYFTVTCGECDSEIGLFEQGESYVDAALEHFRDDHPPPPPRPLKEIRADIDAFFENVRNNP